MPDFHTPGLQENAYFSKISTSKICSERETMLNCGQNNTLKIFPA
jgi:hypothetical protein